MEEGGGRDEEGSRQRWQGQGCLWQGEDKGGEYVWRETGRGRARERERRNRNKDRGKEERRGLGRRAIETAEGQRKMK